MRAGIVLDETLAGLDNSLRARLALEGSKQPPLAVVRDCTESLDEALGKALGDVQSRIDQQRAGAAEGAAPSVLTIVVVCDLEDPDRGTRALRALDATVQGLIPHRAAGAHAALLREFDAALVVALPRRPATDPSKRAKLGAFLLDLECFMARGQIRSSVPLQRAVLLAAGNYEPQRNPRGLVTVPEEQVTDLLAEIAVQILGEAGFRTVAPRDRRCPEWVGAAALVWRPGAIGRQLAAARLAELCRTYLERPSSLDRRHVEEELARRALTLPDVARRLCQPQGAPPGGVAAEVALDLSAFARPPGRTAVDWNLELPFLVLLAQDRLEKYRLPRAMAMVREEAARLEGQHVGTVQSLADRWAGAPVPGTPPDPDAGIRQAVAGVRLMREALLDARASTEGGLLDDDRAGATPRRLRDVLDELVPRLDPGLARLARRVPDPPDLASYWKRFKDLVQHQPLPSACLARSFLAGLPLAALVSLVVERFQYTGTLPRFGVGFHLFPSVVFAVTFAALLLGGLAMWALWQLRVRQAKERLLVAIAKLYRGRLRREIAAAASRLLTRLVDLLGDPDAAEPEPASEVGRLRRWREAVERGGAEAERVAASTLDDRAEARFCRLVEAPSGVGYKTWDGPFDEVGELADLLGAGWASGWRDRTTAAESQWFDWLRERGYHYLEEATIVEILSRHDEPRRDELVKWLTATSFPHSLFNFAFHTGEQPLAAVTGPADAEKLQAMVAGAPSAKYRPWPMDSLAMIQSLPEPGLRSLDFAKDWLQAFQELASRDQEAARQLCVCAEARIEAPVAADSAQGTEPV